MHLSEAMCREIEHAHLRGGGMVAEHVGSGDGGQQDRSIAGALTARGIFRHVGRYTTDEGWNIGEEYELTDFGRQAYATHGLIIRRDSERCGNPTCCDRWADDAPEGVTTHGSCPRCSRWIAVTRDGRMKRHTIQPGHQCPGVGQLREGMEVAA